MLDMVGNVWENMMWSPPSRGSQSNDRDIYLNGKPCHMANTPEEILTRGGVARVSVFSWRQTALHVFYISDGKWK